MFNYRNNRVHQQTANDQNYNREESGNRSYNIHKIIDSPQSDQFSFKQLNASQDQALSKSNQLYKSQSTISLKQNLQLLPKAEIIELLLQEISLSQNNPAQKQAFNETLKAKNNQKNYKKQYDQLVRDFEEYINNTREAQQHYLKIIDDLKKQNKSLENQLLKKTSDYRHSQTHSPKFNHDKIAQKIQKLQQTVQNYLRINNQLINKVEQLQILNEKITDEKNKIKEDNQFLLQDYETLIKLNQKISNQNTAFKSIVDELKDYIMQRRQAKQQAGDNSDTERSKLPSQRLIAQNQKNTLQLVKESENSIINSSQIKRREITLNDSTLMFEKDYNGVANVQYEDKFSKSYSQTQVNQNSYQQADSASVYLNEASFKSLQQEIKELRINNEKLEQLLDRKADKIRLLMEQVDTLKEQKRQLNEQIIELKCRIKKMQSSAHNQSTAVSKCTSEDLRVSIISNVKDFNPINNQGKIYNIEEKKTNPLSKSTHLKDYSNYLFKKSQSACFQTPIKSKDTQNYEDSKDIKADENRQKSYNRESAQNYKPKHQPQNKIYERQTPKISEQYYVPKTLIASNKNF